MYIKDTIDRVKREMQRQARMENATRFALGAFIGAAVGAALGFLLAPKAGKETREELADRVDKIKKAGKNIAKTVGEKVRQGDATEAETGNEVKANADSEAEPKVQADDVTTCE